jgi:hypothetical protein
MMNGGIILDIKLAGKKVKIELDPRNTSDREIIGVLCRKLKQQGQGSQYQNLLRAAGMEEPPEIDPGG